MQRAFIDGRYLIERLLGSGGMAKVYLAHDEVLDRDVALKILGDQYAEDEEFVERFRREARSAASLSHPNIVSIYDQGRSEEGAYYIAMEYVPGETLKERIRREGALQSDAAVGVALQITEALSAAHGNGVVHRDIKPQNVLVPRTGEAKVTDFGIARATTATTTSRSSLILGTAGYMSPEQARGEPVGPRSDLYSLGVVLYEMLTGMLPYESDNAIAQAMKHINEPPRSPRETDPNVPEVLDILTVKLLATNPEDRYASAAELADDLERVQSGLPPTAAVSEKSTEKMTAPLPPSPEGQTRKSAVQPPVTPMPIRAPEHGRRRQGRLFVALAALLLGLALLSVLAWALTQGFIGVGSVEVPSLEGLTREEARERLAESGLTLGEVYEAPSDSVPKGTAIEQDPQAGSSVDPDTSVDITLSAGPERVTVPDLAGLSLSQAEQVLSEVGLKLGRQEETPSDTVPVGVVTEQDPAEGTEAEEGTAVDIVVSTGLRQVPADENQAQEEEKQRERQRQEEEKQREKQQQEEEKQREKQQQEEEKQREKGE